ncbi:hypothetical protein TSAR_000415 [Trichomalopsis sarcophagae]|uniref:Uncharacterized protein n=1 Tax=Trichomalopsis sarcophagae TaxID=543379 RepID=A0A232EWF8_9HYME|nr:hypothetical protein TSAR_000415 [Trichomalopsis sarcophagae]
MIFELPVQTSSFFTQQPLQYFYSMPVPGLNRTRMRQKLRELLLLGTFTVETTHISRRILGFISTESVGNGPELIWYHLLPGECNTSLIKVKNLFSFGSVTDAMINVSAGISSKS